MRVCRAPADACDHARMLQRAIRVEQAGSDRTDVGTHCLPDQQEEPIAVDHFDVIVEEAQVFASRMLHGSVVERGEVERAGDPQDRRASLGYLLQIFERFRIITAVVGDDEFYMWIARPPDAFDASSEVRKPISGRHDNRNHRRRFR